MGLGIEWKEWKYAGQNFYVIAPLRDYFSYPPSAIYAFTGCAATGTLSINIEKLRHGNVWNTETDTTSVSLAALDTALSNAGYTGLLTTDIIIIGDVEMRPGFIIRSGAILPGVFVETSHSSAYPGEPGMERYSIDFVLPEGVLYAFLHRFQRL
jgi:hypothetical protein